MSEQTAPRLKQLFNDKLKAELKKQLQLKNLMEVPVLQKIVVSSGVGKKKDDKKYLETVKNTLEKITGQAATERLAKKSIATFKIRKGQGGAIGYMITLRNDRMYEFLDRLINIALPHSRDFHGVPFTAFDGQGNYNLGVKEQTIFQEISFEDASVLHGLEIAFVIKNGSAVKSKALLEAFGMPFEKELEKGEGK
jgi:large subunit ribosomal protein L5